MLLPGSAGKLLSGEGGGVCGSQSAPSAEEGAGLRQEDGCGAADGVEQLSACFGKSPPGGGRLGVRGSTPPFSHPAPSAGFYIAVRSGWRLQIGETPVGLRCWTEPRSCEPPGLWALSRSKCQKGKSLCCISLRANERKKPGLVLGKTR